MSSRHIPFAVACLLFLSLLFPGLPAVASGQTQITTGAIQGTVSDATGALLPGVTVEVRNVGTNLTRTQTTENDGRFVFLQLPPGTYEVRVSLSGFATVVQQDVPLTVGQTVTLPVVMKVGGVTETVTVSGATGVIESTRTSAATTLGTITVENLPNLGRKFEDLLTLTPGVSVVQGPDGDEITFAGQRGIFNNISLDGGDYNNGFFGEQAGGQRVAVDITLEAVKEFQVIATGAPAEFGRTAGGVVNVITKSGTNEKTGSLFHFQRLGALTGDLSDGTRLEEFHREQWGGTFGGPLKRDRAFIFAALEGITGNFQRPNLGRPLGDTPCPAASPDIQSHEGLINGNPDCQRLALLGFFDSRFNENEARPIEHPIETVAILTKLDFVASPANNVSGSWNFNHSRKENETFDVSTYGASANGIEGDPARINVINLNWFSTLSSRMVNEAHFTYSRESRPRAAVDSAVKADTGMGFSPTFRFGNPFFLQPGVDELIWRTQIKNNLSMIRGSHTIKVGGEWMHTLNDQVFRGFFTGRYIFDSVTGFLRYASPAAPGGFGPNTVRCADDSFVTHPAPCPGGPSAFGGPLLLYLQGAGLDGPATDAAGASNITNDEFALFIQDQWQPRSNLTINYGLRWDAQLMPETIDPAITAYGRFLNDPAFPSDGTIPDQWGMFQPRFGVAWDVKGDGRSLLRGSAGIYSARQNMLSQVGSVTTNGVQQQTIFVNTGLLTEFGAPTPTWPGLLPVTPVAPGEFPLFTGVRVFHRDYENPRIFTYNVAYEQQLRPDWAGYVDFTWAEGRNLTRFLNYNRTPGSCCDQGAGTGNVFTYGLGPWDPFLGEVMVANSLGESRYRGLTIGIRKRFSEGYQLEANYVLAKDEDNDSNERDPFTDRSFNFFDLERDWGPSDRDIRHKVNVFGYFTLPAGIRANARVQARSAQPITPAPRVLDGQDRGRNSARKDNEFFSFDWRVSRSFMAGGVQITPILEMFNTFNNTNNINPLSAPALFNFDGFLRTGVGDPRQAQFAVKVAF